MSLQRHAKGEESIGSIPPIVHDVLRGPGQPLESGTRADMETRFGYDFSSVRIHRGAQADSAAEAVNAAAFTVGRDVVFANAFYQPHTRSGRFLLAHELAHTIQQGPANGARPESIGGVNDAGEAEADAAAQRVATGSATPASFGLARTILTLAKTDCSKLKMGSCRGGVYKCGFRNTGTCGWVGPSRGGCICVGSLGPKDLLIPLAALGIIAALIASLPADIIAGIGVALVAAARWLALLFGLTAGAGLATAGGSEEGGDVSNDGGAAHEKAPSAPPPASTTSPPATAPPAHSTGSQPEATPGSRQSPPVHEKKKGASHPPLKKGAGGHSYRLSVIEGLNLERVTVGKHYAVTFDPKGPNRRFVILQATNKITKGSDTTVDFVSIFECSRAEKQCTSGGNFFSVTHPFHPSEGRAERGKVHSEK